MRVRSGNIPKELVYILTAPQDIRVTWDDCDADEDDEVTVEKVWPTFVSDATNEGTLKTGRSWAQHNLQRQVYDPVTKQWKRITAGLPAEVTRTNDPITKLRIFGLDIRYNGGRAWKCADAEGHYFDLREDVLLDLMRTAGVSEGGYLNGEYIWAKVGAEMKLVRVGSQLHGALTNATSRREMKLVSKKDLKPLSVYQTRTGEVFLYLGHLRYFKPDEAILRASGEWQDPVIARYNSWLGAKRHGGYSKDDYERRFGKGSMANEPPRPPKLNCSYKAVNDHFWLTLNDLWNDGKQKADNFKILQAKKDKLIEEVCLTNRSYGMSKVVQQDSLKIVEELGTLDVPNIYKDIREAAYELLIEKSATQEKDPNYDRVMGERQRIRLVAQYLPWGTLHLKTEEFDESYDAWITLLISKEPV